MEIKSTKLKILSKIVASGADTEKKITSLQTAEIFEIIERQRIPAREMGLILELQNAIRSRSVISFLTDGKDKEEKRDNRTTENGSVGLSSKEKRREFREYPGV